MKYRAILGVLCATITANPYRFTCLPTPTSSTYTQVPACFPHERNEILLWHPVLGGTTPDEILSANIPPLIQAALTPMDLSMKEELMILLFYGMGTNILHPHNTLEIARSAALYSVLRSARKALPILQKAGAAIARLTKQRKKPLLPL